MPITINGSGTVTGITAGGLPDAIITQPDLAANVAGNGPAFSVTTTGSQSLTTATYTKITFNTKVFDTNTNFDASTNYRFTPTVAGYYLITSSLFLNGSALGQVTLAIYKNGSVYRSSTNNLTTTQQCTPVCTEVVYLNGSTDYVEIYLYQNSGSTLTTLSSRPDLIWFSGSMVRAA